MLKSAQPVVRLNLRAPAGHPMMAERPAAPFRSKLEAYTAQMLAELGIPFALQVTWEKQPPGNHLVEASVNGSTARLRHATATGRAVSPAAFSVAFCEDILRNRALFLTPEAVSRAVENAHESLRRFSEKDQARVAQILFAQGFGLQRLSQFSPATNTPDKTPEAWAEACIGDLEATRLLMLAHPSQIDPDDNPHDFNRLVEGADYFVDAAFKVKGVPFPKIKTEKRGDFAPDEIAFQINDLLFPTRKIGDVQTENLQFVNFLTSIGTFFLNRGSVNYLLDSLEATNPNLLALARSRFSIDFITAILRNLSAEGISVRPLVRILEILVSGGQDVYRQQPALSEAPPLSEIIHLTATDKSLEQLDLSDWSELVRVNLKNAIINRALLHFEEPLVLSCFYFETALLEKIARLDTLSPNEQSGLCQNVYRQMGENRHSPAGKIRPVITAAAFRKKIRDLIAFEFPDTPVFSLQECLPRIVARFDQMISA